MTWLFYIASQLDSISQSNQNTAIVLDKIKEPPPVQFSFDTIGWKVLFIVLIGICIFYAFKILIRYRKMAYKRDAHKKLTNLEQVLNISNCNQSIEQMAVELKLVAIQSYGRTTVANLYGKQWIEFLKNSAKSISFEQYESFYMNAIYHQEVTIGEAKTLLKISKQWINHHA